MSVVPSTPPGTLAPSPLHITPPATFDSLDWKNAHDVASVFENKVKLPPSSYPPSSLTERLQNIFSSLHNEYHVYRKPAKIWNIIGVVAAVVSVVAIIPQINQIHERQSACDVSMSFLVGNLVVQCLWCIYSLGNRLWMNAMFTCAFILGIVYMIAIKVHYDAGNACALPTPA